MRIESKLERKKAFDRLELADLEFTTQTKLQLQLKSKFLWTRMLRQFVRPPPVAICYLSCATTTLEKMGIFFYPLQKK